MNGALLMAAALVWAPPETFTQWSKVDALLRARPELKLTIALTPAMATPLAKAALSPWAALGRVEIAARAAGDPVLPFVAAHPAAPRPDDALESAASARQAVEKRLSAGPAGFLPGDGALEPSLIGPLGALGAPWILVGRYELAGGSWAAAGRTAFVPARVADELTAPGPQVADESALPETRVLPLLEDLRAKPERGWATISELLKAPELKLAPAESVAAWPGWSGAKAAAPAWEAYGQAAQALARYQNSGAADMKILDGANELLRKAQEARFFRPPEPGSTAGLPTELRSRLLAVYKRLKIAAPEGLYSGAAAAAAGVPAEQPTGVHAMSGADWLAFDNPLGTDAKIPAGATNADPWRLIGLRVEWNDERVLFRLLPARVDAAPPAPRPIYDVYIDLNHHAGAGSIRLLAGRGAFAQARDAWEYALSVVGSEARLLRATAGDPEEISVLKTAADPAKSELHVSVPRELLRGNPARWGFSLLALAEDPAGGGRVLVGPDGAQTLGLLAPIEVQKAVLGHPGTPQRVAAVRLEAAAR